MPYLFKHQNTSNCLRCGFKVDSFASCSNCQGKKAQNFYAARRKMASKTLAKYIKVSTLDDTLYGVTVH